MTSRCRRHTSTTSNATAASRRITCSTRSPRSSRCPAMCFTSGQNGCHQTWSRTKTSIPGASPPPTRRSGGRLRAAGQRGSGGGERRQEAMIWRLDYTGRFPQRPHWEVDELERRCEEVMVPFLEGRYGQVPIRLPTDALTVLIEREAEELDLHADLIADNNDEEIHGVTWFFPGAKPKVQIN